MAWMEGLGRLYDVGLAWSPVDSQSGNITGKRIWLGGATGIAFVVNKAAGTAGDDPTYTVQQHTAYTGGTTSSLAVVDHYYVKSETTLDNDESWQKITQSVAATVADPGGAGTSAESQQLLLIEVGADQLSDGYAWVSLNLADTGSAGAQLASAVYILHDLAQQRAAANLPNLLRPGSANA
jgi:hypothetical protein